MQNDAEMQTPPRDETSCGCLFCMTGKERLVVERIHKLYPEIHAIVARKEKYQTCAGQKSRVEAVLLPSYVFFEAASDADPSALAEVEDVIRILSMDEGVWQLHGEDERFARWLLRYDGLLSFSKAYREGERIRILRGPLKDMEGKIIRVDKRGRSGQVLLNFNGREFPVWLGFELTEPESPFQNL